MKNLLIIFCFSVFSVSLCFAQNDVKKFAEQFTVKDNPVKVANNKSDGVFNLYKVHKVSNLKRSNPEDWMIEYTKKIKKMVTLSSIPMPKSKVDNIMNDVLRFCRENGYENANNDNSSNSTNVFYKKDNDQVTGLITIGMISHTERTGHFEVRCISGKFSFEDISKIVSENARLFN
jgi:hypothetical protein